MRCFIAIDIPQEIREKLGKIQENLRIGGVKPVESKNLHFTLKFLGEISEETADKVKEILLEIRRPGFDAVIGGIGAFPNIRHPRVIWAGCECPQMEDLAKEIDYKIGALGFPAERDYKNHLTLARIKELKKPEAGQLGALMEQLETIEIGKMTVSEFSLKQSRLLPKGPVYTDIKRFAISF